MPEVVGDWETWAALLPDSVFPCAGQLVIQPHLFRRWVMMGKAHLLMPEVPAAQFRVEKVGDESSSKTGAHKAMRVPSTPSTFNAQSLLGQPRLTLPGLTATPTTTTIRRRGDGRERIEMQHVVFPRMDNACPPSSGREPRAPQP